MPANLTPQYRAAEARFKAARSPDEKRQALEEMLATIPKHKGTEKLQAELKRRLARLRHEEEAKSHRHGHTFKVEPEGAAQVVLLGPPNCGKSQLLGALTRAEPVVADYPFTTTRPQPGMMHFEDVQIQLVDLPAVAAEHLDPWLPGIVRGADAAVLIVDPTSPVVPEDVEIVRERLAAQRIPLVGELPLDADPRDTPLPTLVVFNKVDRAREEDLEVLQEIYGEYPVVRVSALKHTGFEAFKVALWRRLQLVRVYSRPPGKPADMKEPFVIPEGSTLLDLAERIHREVAERLQFARVWGGRLDGQRVARDFELRDRDVVEIHA
ncbi:MAG TPA: TGS domain-containing protein [Thermoanaerobaculaceae bacterium]|nr:TGS domain-containing protein [Thermoanaerobaculaceae bacterium]HRS16023.1 TGS domain-containing protein [Thermoanaerobaculaceae bacterium]